MPLIHYLYIGHFIPEEDYVRFQDHKPVVTRPLNMRVVVKLLRNYLGPLAELDGIPDDWATTVLSDYIVCDYLGSPPAALEFVADYAEEEGATIIDMGSFSLMTPTQLRQSVSELLRAQPA